MLHLRRWEIRWVCGADCVRDLRGGYVRGVWGHGLLRLQRRQLLDGCRRHWAWHVRVVLSRKICPRCRLHRLHGLRGRDLLGQKWRGRCECVLVLSDGGLPAFARLHVVHPVPIQHVLHGHGRHSINDVCGMQW